MKKLALPVFMALLLAMLFQRCNQDDVNSQVEKIQFAISISPHDASTGGRIKVALPPEASVLLSIESSSGNPVFTQRAVKVYAFGDSYITDPVELAPGDYKITDFLVVDASSEIVFAAPKKGSPLASVVGSPLPRSLHISRNNVANVDVQVLDVNQHAPEDFGYVSFNIKAGADFRIAVFADINGKSKFTDANAYILMGADTLYHYDLKAKVNNVFFAGDPDSTYTLVVVKPGYETYTQSFKFSELGDTPLKVYLMASMPSTNVFRLWFSPASVPDEPPIARYSMILGADEAANITVDFGNGTVQHYSIPAGSSVEAVEIIRNDDVLIQVTGDIEKITTFMPYWEGHMKKIDFSVLPNLKQIKSGPFDFVDIPTIDLTHNNKLERAEIGGTFTDSVFLPADHAIKIFNINDAPKLSASEIDALIDNVYANTVNHNILDGTFYNKSLGGQMQGPPSAASLTKLRSLRDAYGWDIIPNPN